MRDHVLSLVSHDLRSPLNAIHSWAYVLERKLSTHDDAAERALAGIRTGVEQQVALLENVVDATRAATRLLTPAQAPFELAGLVAESVGIAQSALGEARHVGIAAATCPEQTLSGDRARLGAALWLMLTFAIEASAEQASVTLEHAVDATKWRATVRFDAVPAVLEDANRPHLLEAFALRQALTAREPGRIAWVLALCQRVAQAHGGSFEQHDAGQSGAPGTTTLALEVPLLAAA